MIRRKQRSPKTTEKSAQSIGSPLRKETQQLPETAAKQLRTQASRWKRKKTKEASTPDGRPSINSEPCVGPSIGKRASKRPSESPTPKQRDGNIINRTPNEKRRNLTLIHNIMTAYMTTNMDNITRTAHMVVDNMHYITVNITSCCSTSL